MVFYRKQVKIYIILNKTGDAFVLNPGFALTFETEFAEFYE